MRSKSNEAYERNVNTDKSYIFHNQILQHGIDSFIIGGIEGVNCLKKVKSRHKIVPPVAPPDHIIVPTKEQLREQAWLSKLDTIHHGYNRIKAVAMKRLLNFKHLIRNKHTPSETHRLMKQWHPHQYKLPSHYFDRYTDDTLLSLAEQLTAQHRSSSEWQLGKTLLKS
jgi:hypothetical protein